MNSILSIIWFFSSQKTPCHSTVQFEVENVKTNEGYLRVAIFRTAEEYRSEKPFKHIDIKKPFCHFNVTKFKIDLPIDTYGIAIYDDANSDNRMNYNLIGLPKEGFGFSNYEFTGMVAPKFDKFALKVSSPTQTIHFKLRYLGFD